MNFIEIKGNLSFKTGDLAAKLTKGGLEFYEEMDSEYFSKLVEDYIYAMNQVDYTANNLKVLRGYRNESYYNYQVNSSRNSIQTNIKV